MKLIDKKAIVTGGASGIGKAIALAYVQEGAQVAIFDFNPDKAAQTVGEIKQVTGKTIESIKCDVGSSSEVARAFQEADQALGGIDILVNNAGIIRNNLKSVFLCSKEAGKRMIAQKRGGRIIAISSIHAVLSEPSCGHYTAAKGGIEAFCRTLATELAPHKVTVNYIRPGATYTELTNPMYTESVVRSLYERVPLKQIAKAEWIAAGAVFLACDEACYMTGQHLTIDGGYVMDGSLPGAKYWEK